MRTRINHRIQSRPFTLESVNFFHKASGLMPNTYPAIEPRRVLNMGNILKSSPGNKRTCTPQANSSNKWLPDTRGRRKISAISQNPIFLYTSGNTASRTKGPANQGREYSARCIVTIIPALYIQLQRSFWSISAMKLEELRKHVAAWSQEGKPPTQY